MSAVAEDLNHGAGDGSHFYLLPTLLLDNNLKEGLTDYYENINHILDYGEFRHPEYDPMLRRGIREPVIRSYDKYTQISSDNTAKVTTTSNVFSAILSQIAIVKEQQELTTAFLLDEENNDDSVAKIQDVPVVTIQAEPAVEEDKQNESAGNITITNEETEFQRKQSEFLMQQLLPNILLLQNGGGDSNQIMQNIFMQTNIFMTNFQSIIKSNKMLADLSINKIEAPNKLTTKNDTIDNNIDVSSKTNKNNKSKTKSPNKRENSHS